ncbi:MAG: tetratricopeptide repeat protein [Chloroflexota bacterium]|nr:tetratricopeptide repeat protein [Chloroflexota bacterium]
MNIVVAAAAFEALENLPSPLTPFVGREAEVASLCSLLRQDGIRLVTLTGPGGIGKTRLALRVASDLRHEFADGVRFISLAAVTDPDLLPVTIAGALGVREESHRSALTALMDALRDRHQLLVLDNLERLVDGAGVITDLLTACTGMKVVATSRTRLRLRGEHERPVPPLTLPPPRGAEAAPVLDYDAVRLFVDRARGVDPSFAITTANAAVVAEICRQLDGLPLAIELAGARVKVLSPDALLARLTNRLRVLIGGPRDLPERQRTLRDTIAWSHDLLDREEQILFRRLAVFAGGFTLEAAEGVCAGGSDVSEEAQRASIGRSSSLAAHSRITALDTPVLDLLGGLVDDSLLQGSEPRDGEPRFSMLETVREYALERLAESGEEAAIRAAHAAWFLDVAEQAEVELAGPHQITWLSRLEADHENLRVALDWSSTGGDAGIGLRLASALWRFWAPRGHLREGREWLERALLTGEDAPPATRAKALHHLGNLALDLDDYPRAEAAYEASLHLWRAHGNEPGVAAALNGLGLVASNRGDYREAMRLHGEALDLRRKHGDRYGITLSLHNLGNVARDEGDYERARALHEEVVERRRELGDLAGLAYSSWILGQLAAGQGDADAAGQRFEEGLRLFREVGDKLGIGYTLVDLARLAHQQGDDKQAVSRYREALTLRREMGDQRGVVECLEGLASVALAQGQPEHAVQLLGGADAWREAAGAPLPPAARAGHLQEIADASAALGESRFATAWKTGRATPLEETIAVGEAIQVAGPVAADDVTPDLPANAGLTTRELEVLRLFAAGHDSFEVADLLFISRRTVTTHSSNILAKLGVNSRAAAVGSALRLGLV